MAKTGAADPHTRTNIRGLDTLVTVSFQLRFLLIGRFTQTGGKMPMLTEV